MSDTDKITVDPWSSTTDRLPRNARFVCAYNLDLGIDTIEEEVFVRRIENQNELWTANEFGRRRVIVAPRRENLTNAALYLLDLLFRSRIGFEWPSSFIFGGIIKKAAYDKIVGDIERELDANTSNAREDEAEIVVAARDLDLSPTPGGLTPNHWLARCPETNHNLHIDAADNEFGCGWCKRKGGPDELRLFREDRRKWKQELSEGR